MGDPVWMMVMFDLPVLTAEQSKKANAFRNLLFDLGCSRVQLSVYVKFLPNASQSTRLLEIIKANVAPGGAVRVLRVSDAVWSSMKRYEGSGERPAEEPPEQLSIF